MTHYAVNNCPLSPWQEVFEEDFTTTEDQPGVRCSHFLPISKFIEGGDGFNKRVHKYLGETEIVEDKYQLSSAKVYDATSGDIYNNDGENSKCYVRIKFFMIATFGLLALVPANAINMIFRAVIILTGYHFWRKVDGEAEYSFCKRLGGLGVDFIRMITAPIVFLLQITTAVYGCIITPRNGRKLFAALERASYGVPVIAYCMHAEKPSGAARTPSNIDQ